MEQKQPPNRGKRGSLNTARTGRKVCEKYKHIRKRWTSTFLPLDAPLSTHNSTGLAFPIGQKGAQVLQWGPMKFQAIRFKMAKKQHPKLMNDIILF